MALTEEVAEGVHGIKLGFVNAFVVGTDDGSVLVDAGMPRRAGKIHQGLREAGHDPGALRHVLVTHHHEDHVGSLAALREGTTVYVHPADAPKVTGDEPRPGPFTGPLLRPVIAVVRRVSGMHRVEPTSVDRRVTEGDELPGGIRAVHTPGHTAGHLSFLLPDLRVLIAGDAAANLRRLSTPFPYFTEDMAEAKRSIAKLAELDFDTACFGHGTVLRGGANAAFRRFVEGLASA